MFNNCNSNTNGEKYFYTLIKDKIQTIFDIGCRNDSLFNDFAGEVHYFDPMPKFIEEIKSQHTLNNKSFYNAFGLGLENSKKWYYPNHQSFVNRIKCCGNDEKNKIELEIKTGEEYIKQLTPSTYGDNAANNNVIKYIDFIKIDTEGYELDVLKGFGDYLKYVKVIQFEYGGTYLDNNIKLSDVISYLISKDFGKFSYLSASKVVPIDDFTDHYKYSNIVCVNTQHDLYNLY